MKKIYLPGTNQYKKKTAWYNRPEILFVIPMLYFAIAYMFHNYTLVAKPREARAQMISPVGNPSVKLPYKVLEVPTVSPAIEPRKEVADYVKTVFGKDADKAFSLLSCENASLNPEAVNTAGNYPEGSRDIGVFQINEFWQHVQGKFLFNYKINIEIAHQIYQENGDFHLWTCGRGLGV